MYLLILFRFRKEMKYSPPHQVRSPRGFAKQVTPLYDGDVEGYSIAILENSDGYKNIGIRWNVSEKESEDPRKIDEGVKCVGMPQSRGYSVWFILPDATWQFIPQMIKEEINVRGKQNFLNISEAQIQEEVARIIEERDQD